MTEPDKATHCRHADCCQCGAKRGTPEHEAECMAARIGRALAKRSKGYVSRKLVPR